MDKEGGKRDEAGQRGRCRRQWGHQGRSEMTEGTGCSLLHVGAEVGGWTGKMYGINIENGNGLIGGT